MGTGNANVTFGQPGSTAQMKGTWFNLSGSSVYAPEKFYTNSTDTKGHYERVRCKVTPSLQALCEQIVAVCPDYASVEDMIRDALTHRVMWLRANGLPMDEQAVKREAHQAEMARMRAIASAQETYIDECTTTIDIACENHNWAQLEDVLSEMESQVATGGYPPVIAERLSATIAYGWSTMKSELSSRQMRRRVTNPDA